MIDSRRLQNRLEKHGIMLTDRQLEQLDIYARLLVEWNEKINLTAITEPEEIENKHFLDSLLLTKQISRGRVIDVGTGAGFPGMVLKIACPQVELFLLDGLEKRLRFLDKVKREIGVECETMHGRAEDAGHMPELREQFDYATARAVAPLNVLSEFCLPFVRIGGSFCAMKGGSAADETEQAANAIALLGGEIADRSSYQLPDGSEREIVTVTKTATTAEKYPRRAPVIKKKPL